MSFERKTAEELEAMSPEDRALYWQEFAAEQEKIMQAKQVELDTAQALLNSRELNRTRTVDRTTHANGDNVSTLNTQEDEAKKAIDMLLARYGDEAFSDPATMRKLMAEFGREAISIAFKQATGHSLFAMSKALEVKASTDAVVAAWRVDNKDIAGNKRIEDFIESVLKSEVAPEFAAKGLTNQYSPTILRQMIDEATKRVRDQLDLTKKEGEKTAEEREAAIRAQKTLTPTRVETPGVRSTRRTETPDETPEQALSGFLKQRRELNEKRMGVIY